ncbi:hypothetical protein D3C81_1662960 [compost metagenome]
MQHVFQAGLGDTALGHGGFCRIGVQHQHALAWHRTHQAEGLQHGHRFTQARSADAQLFGQFTLARKHVTGTPLAAGQGLAEFFHH